MKYFFGTATALSKLYGYFTVLVFAYPYCVGILFTRGNQCERKTRLAGSPATAALSRR